jgi:hypothetical protein
MRYVAEVMTSRILKSGQKSSMRYRRTIKQRSPAFYANRLNNSAFTRAFRRRNY